MAIEKKDKLLLVKSLKVQEDGQWYGVKNELSSDLTYIYLQHSKLRNPNISSHVLVDLMGKNPYTTPGKALLQAFGLLEYVAIDPYYTVRGGVVEVLAEEYIKKVLYPSLDLKVQSYELTDFKGYNQFPQHAPFSGVLDKAILEPFKLPIEIKSKEMKDYKWIVEKGKHPENEVIQGMQLSDLWGTDKVLMIWGFIDLKLQRYLKDVINAGIVEEFKKMQYGELHTNYEALTEALGLTYKDVTWEFQIYDVNKQELDNYRTHSLGIYNEVITERRIPRKWFSHSELEDLDEFIKKIQGNH